MLSLNASTTFLLCLEELFLYKLCFCLVANLPYCVLDSITLNTLDYVPADFSSVILILPNMYYVGFLSHRVSYIPQAKQIFYILELFLLQFNTMILCDC